MCQLYFNEKKIVQERKEMGVGGEGKSNQAGTKPNDRNSSKHQYSQSPSMKNQSLKIFILSNNKNIKIRTKKE